jgi:hypothetical protein
MRLLIPTSLKWWRNGFPVDTYCPWWNKIETQRSVDQINNYYFTLSNGFQLFFALIFISVLLLALIIARVYTHRDVILCVNVKGLCVWGRMTAFYYVHKQLLGLKPTDTWHYTSDLYFGDALFESRPWHRLAWLRFYGDFLSQNFEACLKLGNIFPLLVQSEDLLHYPPETTTCP